nr:Chain B, Amyloid beta A4 protein [Homo sapiens]
ENPTYKFFEQ